MTDTAALLRIYDDQLRTEAELIGAHDVTRIGPLWMGTYRGGYGFITYRDLEGVAPEDLPALAASALDHFSGDPGIVEVEWKTRGHDRAPGLEEALWSAGFAPGDRESVMLGEAASLALDAAVPEGVVIRRIESEEELRAMVGVQDRVFTDGHTLDLLPELLERLRARDGVQFWVAEAKGSIVSTGRLDPVPGTQVAGIWGGATLPEWRHRGIYRALTATRARAALDLGKAYLHSDSTEMSRPILERAGLAKITTTTPWTWAR